MSSANLTLAQELTQSEQTSDYARGGISVNLEESREIDYDVDSKPVKPGRTGAGG